MKRFKYLTLAALVGLCACAADLSAAEAPTGDVTIESTWTVDVGAMVPVVMSCSYWPILLVPTWTAAISIAYMAGGPAQAHEWAVAWGEQQCPGASHSEVHAMAAQVTNIIATILH